MASGALSCSSLPVTFQSTVLGTSGSLLFNGLQITYSANNHHFWQPDCFVMWLLQVHWHLNSNDKVPDRKLQAASTEGHVL